MGKVIRYDFRKEQRHKEYNEIQDRIMERTIMQLQDSTYYLNPEVQERVREDNLSILQLEIEAEEWGDDLNEE